MGKTTRGVVVVVTVLWSVMLWADEPVIVPREVLEAIVDEEPNPLPRYRTEAERSLPLPTPDPYLPLAPPHGVVYTPPEYAKNDGLLVRWGSFNTELTAMIVPLTTGDPDAIAHILVSSPGLQASATSVLSTAGADMSQVNFILYSSDSVWIRDYGPRFIREDAERAMVDHTYNRNRPDDNAFPDYLSTLWGETQYDIPLTHGGGNFHLFSTGEAFMSDLILDENPGLTEQQVKDYYRDYQNLDLTIFPGFPYAYDGTRHIDMWMLPVDDDEVIIGAYDPGAGDPYTITEAAVTEFENRGYTVHRTPGWVVNPGVYPTHYTYTNSVVFNDLVFMCEFNGYPLENQAALIAFNAAYPGKTIVPVDCTEIINYAGAIHCIVMHVPEVGALIFSDDFESGTLDAWIDLVE